MAVILAIVVLISCSKEDDYDPCDGNTLQQDLLIYDTLHNPVSSYFQYQLYDTLTFLDSIGNELKLVAVFADSTYDVTSFTDDCTGFTETRHSNLFGVQFHHITDPWEIDLYIGRLTPRYSFLHGIPSYDHMQIRTRYDNSSDYYKGVTGWIYPESNNSDNGSYGVINGVSVNAQPTTLVRNDTLLQNMIIVTEHAGGGKAHFYVNTNYELVGFTLTNYVSPSLYIYPDVNVCQWMLKSYW